MSLDLESRGELGDGAGEAPPAHVGLGTGEQRDARSEAVGAHTRRHLRPFEPLVDPVDDLELRAAGPLVEQLLGVEHRVRPRLDRLEQGRHGALRRRARRRPSPRARRRAPGEGGAASPVSR